MGSSMRHLAFLGAAVSLVATPLVAQMRDSAGISIVESPSPRRGERAIMRLGERPTAQIGVQSGDRNLQFNQIVAAIRLSDGSIVVADRGSGEIRTFDASGRFVRKVGRKGRGPGEFPYLTDVRELAPDTLVVWDYINRFTVLTRHGDVVRTFGLRGGPEKGLAGSIVRGALEDGSFFAVRVSRQPPPRVKSITRDTLHVALYSRDGAFVRAVAKVLGLERLLHAGGTMRGPNGQVSPAFSVTGVPFARETHMQAGADWLYIGAGDSYDILGYDRSGTLKRIIRVAEPATRVTGDIIARHRKEPRRRDSPSRPNVWEKIDASWYPRTLPAYAALRVDGAQRLWVKDYPVPGAKEHRWRVFDRSGAFIGYVMTPADLDVLEIGTDYILGRWLDELEVEYVRLYALSPAR